MKNFALALFACIYSLGFCQTDEPTMHNYAVNIGLKTSIHSQPKHNAFFTPYVSAQIKRFEIGGIWWKIKSNDPRHFDQFGQPAIDLKSERTTQLEFINFFLDPSRHWYIGIGRYTSDFRELQYNKMTGLYASDIVDPVTGTFVYEWGHQDAVFEVSNKEKLYYLGTGLKINVYKNLIVQPEVKVGIYESKRVEYKQRILDFNDPNSIENAYWLQSVTENRISMQFGLDLIYQFNW